MAEYRPQVCGEDPGLISVHCLEHQSVVISKTTRLGGGGLCLNFCEWINDCVNFSKHFHP